jgi:para-nitrobenzyl esterase
MSPQKALETGAVMRIPVMLGTTDDEMGRYIVGLKLDNVDDFHSVLKKEWPEHADALAAAYPVHEPEQVKPQMAALFSDWANTCPIRHDARMFVKLGAPAYLYRFKRAPDVFGDRSKGAFHGSELAFLFPSVFAKHQLVVSDEDRVVAQTMSRYWGHFAATGDPNGAGAPVWPRYDVASDPYIALDATTTAATKLHTAECDLWDRIDP